jgi:hypothetical protein
MTTYQIAVSSSTRTEIYEVEEPSEALACSAAASLFFYDWPSSVNVRIASVTPLPPPEDTVSARYTAYGAQPQASAQTSYQPYGGTCEEVCCDTLDSGYTPYGSSNSTVATAGFTTVLPAPPVAATSYHQTLENGYAPYRSFRVKIPR